MLHAMIQPDQLTYGPGPKRLDPEMLVRKHRDLVRRIAWSVYGGLSSKVELEDLIQIGLIALVEAARTFEERGAIFSSYAATRVRGAMIDQLRREASTTRAGMANRRALAAIRKKLVAETGRAVTDFEMATAMKLAPEAYHAMVASAQSIEHESIDEIYKDDQPWFADLSESADTQLERSQLLGALSDAIGGLAEREALVLQLYFVEQMNLDEIGVVLEVGAARVCQIKKSALSKLRVILSPDR